MSMQCQCVTPAQNTKITQNKIG